MQRFLYFIAAIFIISCQKQWYENYDYDTFRINGRDCIFIRPNGEANGNHFVRPAFLGLYPQVDDSLLSRGWSFAFCDVTHEYANYKAQEDFEKFYKYIMEHYDVKPKFALEGLSRGGIFLSLMQFVTQSRSVASMWMPLFVI